MAKREVIIPAKKYVIKFIKLLESQTENEELIDYLMSWEIRILQVLEMFLHDFILEDIRLLENGYLPREEARVEVKKLRSTKNLDNDLKRFISSGYGAIKLVIHSNKIKKLPQDELIEAKEISSRYAKYELLNINLEQIFHESVMSFIHGNTPVKKLDKLYEMLGLDNSDYNKKALLKYYNRNQKKSYKIFSSTKNYHFDKEIPDFEIFDILKAHIEDNTSYSTLAHKYSCSKTRISSICKDPNAIDFYKNISRYHEDWFDYIKSPLRKKSRKMSLF